MAAQITIWNGNYQTFGVPGVPQKWVNILGRVTGAASLSYTLNAGAPVALGIGPNSRRLAEAGDFNVDIDKDLLNLGENALVITALDGEGTPTVAAVTINWLDQTWPLPYTTNFGSRQAGEAYKEGLQVDGYWLVQGTGIHPDHMDYDRGFAIGDYSWTDYELTASFTVIGTDPTGYPPPSNGLGFGFYLRWPGHSTNNGSTGQPMFGWTPNGANNWHDWDNGLKLSINGVTAVAYNPALLLTLNQKYHCRFRVETVAGLPTYRYRYWRDGDAEPGTWTMEAADVATGVARGCILAVAHHLDVLIGDIAVTYAGPPLPTTTTYTVDTGGTPGVDCDFTSLAAAFGVGGIAERGLVAGNKIVVIQCKASTGVADTTAVVTDAGGAWTVDKDHYIIIEPATGAGHVGIWDAAKYRLVVNGLNAITLKQGFTHVRYLQLESTYAGNDNSYVVATSNLDGNRVYGNIVRNVTANVYATRYKIGVYCHSTTATHKAYVYNNIVHGFNWPATYSGGIHNYGLKNYISNNTIVGCSAGVERFSGTVVAKNNIAQLCTDGFKGTFDAASDHNISDVAADAPNATFPGGLGTVSFVPGSYLSATGSLAVGAGMILASDTNLPFKLDLLGRRRTVPWDLGANEVYPAGAGLRGARLLGSNFRGLLQ
jgi:hypothetical protein